MFMRWSAFVAVAVAGAIAMAVPTAGASNGLMSVGSNTTLTEDHVGSILISADNVTLDCAGHSVIAPASGADYGITIAEQSGVTVENCAVSGFRRDGIVLLGASHNLLTGNSANGNGRDGDLEASGFLVDSISSSPANGNIFRSNRANGNQGGGFLVHGHGSLVTGTVFDQNVADENLWFGFAGWRASGNTWTHNAANGGAHWGFALLEQSTDNILSGNVATRNTVDGFLLQGASANQLSANTANANGVNGDFEAGGFLIDSNDISNAD